MSEINTKIIVIGTGSVARYVIEMSSKEDHYEIMALADLENPANIGKQINGVAVQCMWDGVIERFTPSECRLVIATGNNKRRKELSTFYGDRGYAFASVISSWAYISAGVEIGSGCIINPYVAIMPNAKISNHVILHSNTVIEHDNRLDDYVNIAPGVSTAGRVSIGEGTYLYTGVSVIPNVTIGKWSVVGAGALVTKDIGDFSKAFGIPAKSVMTSK